MINNTKKIVIKHKELLYFLIPFLLFNFLLLVFSPGIITYDGNNQWEQVKSGIISNAHPFFSTYFMLLLSKIWNTPTVVLEFQVFIFSLFWYVFCKKMFKENKYYKRKIIYTLVISFIPIISLYSITLFKDILYSYYLMFIIYILYKGIENKFIYTYTDILLLGLMLSLVFNYRHNGMITAILILIIFLIIFIKNKIGFKKPLILILCFASLNISISFPKKQYLDEFNKRNNDVVKYPLSTIDNYIIWMYGAHINKNYISKKDLNKLNKVIKIKEWKEIYNPYLINATGFHDKDLKYYNENQKMFRSMFIKYTLKHPFTIIGHYMKADALLWCPIPVGYVYSFDFTDWWPKYEFNNGDLYGYKGIKLKLPVTKKIVEKTTQFTLKFPMKIFYQPANALYASIILLILLVRKNKNKLYYLLLVPAITNTLPLLLINLAQDLRYVYINYLTFLVVGLIYVLNIKSFKNTKLLKNKKTKKQNS